MCCSGAFIVEVMLCVLVNEDVDCINLEGNLRNVLYKDKPLNNLLHFDTVNVLTHYVDELDKFQKKGNSLNSYRITQPSDSVVKEYPALQALKICGSNIGSLGDRGITATSYRQQKRLKLTLTFPGSFREGRLGQQLII